VLDLRTVSGGFSGEQLAVIHEDFHAQNAAVLRGLLGPDALDLVRRRCGGATFLEKDFGDAVGRRGQSADVATVFAITLALNRAPLLNMLEGLLPQPPAAPGRSITGHVARHRPDAPHELYWHDDLQRSERLLGITVNLGAEPYAGGRFQLRVKSTTRITADLVLESPGDAFVFAISPALEHRVTPVTGTAARTVFTGWLVAETLPVRPLSTRPR
jgi:hypothetical protein